MPRKYTGKNSVFYRVAVCGIAFSLSHSRLRAQTQLPTETSKIKPRPSKSAEDARSQLLRANGFQIGQGELQDFDKALYW